MSEVPVTSHEHISATRPIFWMLLIYECSQFSLILLSRLQQLVKRSTQGLRTFPFVKSTFPTSGSIQYIHTVEQLLSLTNQHFALVDMSTNMIGEVLHGCTQTRVRLPASPNPPARIDLLWPGEAPVPRLVSYIRLTVALSCRRIIFLHGPLYFWFRSKSF
jgi:hypothetical protein